MKISPQARAKFEYFAQCMDTKKPYPITVDPAGSPALECFHSYESTGIMPPTCEPDLLCRALNGKAQHGITVAALAEDYVDRNTFARDIYAYPSWVQKEIHSAAIKYAQNKLGFVPAYVKCFDDFTVMGT